MTFFKMIHLLGVILWIGGMFFSYAVLRPAITETLQKPERMRLWGNVFRRFFKLVWGTVAAILVTGLYMIYQLGGAAHVPQHVLVMLLSGLAMVVVYGYVFFACYVPFDLHVAKGRWDDAAKLMGQIRQLMGFNLTLGVLTICFAVLWTR